MLNEEQMAKAVSANERKVVGKGAILLAQIPQQENV